MEPPADRPRRRRGHDEDNLSPVREAIVELDEDYELVSREEPAAAQRSGSGRRYGQMLERGAIRQPASTKLKLLRVSMNLLQVH